MDAYERVSDLIAGRTRKSVGGPDGLIKIVVCNSLVAPTSGKLRAALRPAN